MTDWTEPCPTCEGTGENPYGYSPEPCRDCHEGRVPAQWAVEAGAGALYDLREEEGVRPVVSRWPPADPDEADDHRLEARVVLFAAITNTTP